MVYSKRFKGRLLTGFVSFSLLQCMFIDFILTLVSLYLYFGSVFNILTQIFFSVLVFSYANVLVTLNSKSRGMHRPQFCEPGFYIKYCAFMVHVFMPRRWMH